MCSPSLNNGRTSKDLTPMLSGPLRYAVYPVSSEVNPALAAFRNWLIDEARST